MSDPEKEALQRELNQLRSTYRNQLPQLMVEVDQHWSTLNQTEGSASALQPLNQLLKQLEGSGFANELEEIAIHAARALEIITPYLQQQLPPNQVMLNNLASHIKGLRQAMSQTALSTLHLVKAGQQES